ncbi:MAG: YidC/Oxa1 family membrane protein insertase [Ardenticatenaceae bacterium]
MAIILFTALIKVLTWPLTSKQLKSTKAMQELQPKMKALQEKYKDDREAQTRETMKLYQEMGVNPMMGCLPMLLQFPIWIALYQAIINLANGGLLTAGFLGLPSLACPSADGSICPDTQGLNWVWNVANYAETWPYFILPILTVVTQIAISKFMTPSTPQTSQQSEDPTQAMMKQMTTFMPIMFGFFALQFPAGLSLYWVTNNVLTGIQYFLMNRDSGGGSMTLAAAGADGGPVIEVEAKPKQIEGSKGQSNGKSRRKRKKR